MKRKDTRSNGNGTLPNNVNLIAQGTAIKGEITSPGDIRIDGYLEGIVRSDAKVVIGTNGHVEGDIYCANADVLGKITGTVQCKEILFLKGSAHLDGDMHTNKLVVESGAMFNGSCRMGAKEQKLEAHGKSAKAREAGATREATV